MRRGNAFGRIRLSVSVFMSYSTFESLDVKISFWYAGTPSECLGQVPILRSQGQGHMSINTHIRVWSAVDSEETFNLVCNNYQEMTNICTLP